MMLLLDSRAPHVTAIVATGPDGPTSRVGLILSPAELQARKARSQVLPTRLRSHQNRPMPLLPCQGFDHLGVSVPTKVLLSSQVLTGEPLPEAGKFTVAQQGLPGKLPW